jgi:hypothetical protein
MRWYEEEERYLKILHEICNRLSTEYMELYTLTHSFQTKMRIPAIVLSSCSGVASFGSSGFGNSAHRYISISVGIVNVFIAIIQTYESYLKIGDIVSKSLSCSLAFKKLADSIYCETFIPVEDRVANGITYLRDCFGRYQTILDQAPPLEFHGKKPTDILKQAQAISESIQYELKSPTIIRQRNNPLSEDTNNDDPSPSVAINMDSLTRRRSAQNPSDD